MYMYICVCIYICTYVCVSICVYTQPIPRGMTFSKALSKLKAQSSNVSFATFQWKETSELWALSFETAFENVTPGGIGYICVYIHPTCSARRADKSNSHAKTQIHIYIYVSTILIFRYIYIHQHTHNRTHTHTHTPRQANPKGHARAVSK